jgi:hypothetical protein
MERDKNNDSVCRYGTGVTGGISYYTKMLGPKELSEGRHYQSFSFFCPICSFLVVYVWLCSGWVKVTNLRSFRTGRKCI